MLRTILAIVACTFALTGTLSAFAPSSADAQQQQWSRHSVKKTKKRTVKQTRTRSGRHHHHRSRSGVHGSVHIQLGTPYYHHSYGHYRHYDHGHVHYAGCEHWSHLHYAPRTEVVVIDATPVDPVFVLPELDCPIRTDEKRIGREQWCETPRGNRHGPYRRWYDDGTLAAQGEYEYDQKEGVWVEFHPNGALREEGQYDDGKRSGTWVTWGADGEELVVVDY